MSQCLEEEEEEGEDSDREIQELKQKIRLRRQQIRTRNLLPVYQETEHGSEWCVNTSVPASSGLQDKTRCFLDFLFRLNLRCYNQDKGPSFCQSSALFFFLADQSPRVYLCPTSEIPSKKWVFDMKRTKTIGPRFTSHIVVPFIYMKFPTFYE